MNIFGRNAFRSRALHLALLISLGVAMPLESVVAAAPANDIVVNMRDVELADVADQISRITGRTIVLDPAVKGMVNVTSAEPLSVEGVWDLFQSVLRVQGFAAVRSGRVWRVVPQASAIRDGGARGGGQGIVTRLVRLRNLSPEAAARVFRPIAAQFGSVEPMTNPNAIVVTDYAENVARIEQLARALDNGGGGSFQAFTLKYATARDVGDAIRNVLGDGTQGAGPRVAVDERSNIVLVRGDAPAMAEARRIVALLDQAGGAAPTTRVFRLANADAEGVTDILRGLMGGEEAATNPIARSLATPGGRAALPSVQTGRPNEVGPASKPPSSPDMISTGGTASRRGFSVGDLAIEPAPSLNAIVVRGTPAAIATLEPLINQLDVRRPQVMIEAAIVEISGDAAEQFGVQLGVGSSTPNVSSGGSVSFSGQGISVRDVLSALGSPAASATLGNGLSVNVGSGNDFRVLVQALGQSTKANLLSTPSLTTLDNEPAEIVVGQNVPFRTGSFTTSGNSTNPFTTIERQDVGITLRVVPRIHKGDVIKLEVAQEVSSLAGSTIAGAADLITNRRSIETTVLADDGQTIVLGGLITDDRMSVKSQVPLLGDIPLLGELFKNRRQSQTKRTLFVFLRPTILRDKESVIAAAEARYARLRGDEKALDRNESLLLKPQRARLSVELPGVY